METANDSSVYDGTGERFELGQQVVRMEDFDSVVYEPGPNFLGRGGSAVPGKYRPLVSPSTLTGRVVGFQHTHLEERAGMWIKWDTPDLEPELWIGELLWRDWFRRRSLSARGLYVVSPRNLPPPR